METIISPLIGNIEVESQLEKAATPSKLIGETLLETKGGRRETSIGIDIGIGVDVAVNMVHCSRADCSPSTTGRRT